MKELCYRYLDRFVLESYCPPLPIIRRAERLDAIRAVCSAEGLEPVVASRVAARLVGIINGCRCPLIRSEVVLDFDFLAKLSGAKVEWSPLALEVALAKIRQSEPRDLAAAVFFGLFLYARSVCDQFQDPPAGVDLAQINSPILSDARRLIREIEQCSQDSALSRGAAGQPVIPPRVSENPSLVDAICNDLGNGTRQSPAADPMVSICVQACCSTFLTWI